MQEENIFALYITMFFHVLNHFLAWEEELANTNKLTFLIALALGISVVKPSQFTIYNMLPIQKMQLQRVRKENKTKEK